MNRLQLTLIAISTALLLAMIAFPPWRHVDVTGAKQSMGYGPIWQPPTIQQEHGLNLFGIKLELKEPICANQIDWDRLSMQLAVLIALGTLGVFVAAKPLRT
jgi:hypothetical protein